MVRKEERSEMFALLHQFVTYINIWEYSNVITYDHMNRDSIKLIKSMIRHELISLMLLLRAMSMCNRGCNQGTLEKSSNHSSLTRNLKISLACVMNKTPYSYFRANSICIVVKYKQAKHLIKNLVKWQQYTKWWAKHNVQKSM